MTVLLETFRHLWTHLDWRGRVWLSWEAVKTLPMLCMFGLEAAAWLGVVAVLAAALFLLMPFMVIGYLLAEVTHGV